MTNPSGVATVSDSFCHEFALREARDRLALQGIATGDAAEFHFFFDRWFGHLMRYAAHRAYTEPVAQTVTRAVLRAALNDVKALAAEASVAGWMLTCFEAELAKR